MVIDECLQTEHDFTVARHGISWKFVREGKYWNVICERARLELYADEVVLNGDDLELAVEAEYTGYGNIHLHDFTIAYKGVKE